VTCRHKSGNYDQPINRDLGYVNASFTLLYTASCVLYTNHMFMQKRPTDMQPFSYKVIIFKRPRFKFILRTWPCRTENNVYIHRFLYRCLWYTHMHKYMHIYRLWYYWKEW